MDLDTLLSTKNILHIGYYSGCASLLIPLDDDLTLDATSCVGKIKDSDAGAPIDLILIPAGNCVMLEDGMRLPGPFIFPKYLLLGLGWTILPRDTNALLTFYTLATNFRRTLQLLFRAGTPFLTGTYMFREEKDSYHIEERLRFKSDYPIVETNSDPNVLTEIEDDENIWSRRGDKSS